ncbi:hypothetical protein HXX76_004980 [Chlamydomonas incerta]|uniref:Uncharacterized protein n=1 Tax=Chlamydomonas incerta TaxID=51695 RepID=A0A835T6I3_CHLIN|nr:hypothetical protein HXX76_004980 [Chlamydomonas incerta]|eukprot:KAG2439628.1 hypothetical protein HXX76_004980 [Chlamydomonas incerta]
MSIDGDKAELARLKLQVARLERNARRLRDAKDDMRSKLVNALVLIGDKEAAVEAAEARLSQQAQEFQAQLGAVRAQRHRLEKEVWEARRDVQDRYRALAHQAQAHEEEVRDGSAS